MSGGWAVAAEIACTASGPAALLFGIWVLRRHRRRRREAPDTRRPSLGRVQVDPQYVRDRFADIAGGMPELGRPDPRLFAMYFIPPSNEEGRR